MSQMVEATLPAEQFALYETLQRHSDATFDTLRLVADGTDRLMPFSWAVGADPDSLREALEAHSSTENVELLAAFAGAVLTCHNNIKFFTVGRPRPSGLQSAREAESGDRPGHRSCAVDRPKRVSHPSDRGFSLRLSFGQFVWRSQ